MVRYMRATMSGNRPVGGPSPEFPMVADPSNAQGTYQLVSATEPPEDLPEGSMRETSVYRPPKKCSPCDCFSRWRDGAYTILPEENGFIAVWDVVTLLALLATCIWNPVEAALLNGVPWRVYIAEKTIDVLFFIDMIITFNLAVHTVHLNEGYWIREPLKIAARYTSFPFSYEWSGGWFWVDFPTLIPWEIVLGEQAEAQEHLVRILRLAKMLRLTRMMKLWMKWQNQLGISFAMIRLSQSVSFTLVIVHWLACLWGYIGLTMLRSGKPSWLDKWAKEESFDVDSPLQVYNVALYFATTVLTTVGFGDTTPQNHIEVFLCTGSMLVTGFAWAFVVALVVDVIANMDVCNTRFNERMDSLNTLMTSRGLPHEMRVRMRRHLQESADVQRERHYEDTIACLSVGLQGELAMKSGVDRACSRIWYFKDLDHSVLVDLAQRFYADSYSANEFVETKRKLSILKRGTCAFRGKILVKDSVMGEDMILGNDFLKARGRPRTLTFVEVMCLPKDGLREVCEIHQDFSHAMRKAQIKLALWRGFIWASEQIRAGHWDPDTGPIKQAPGVPMKGTRLSSMNAIARAQAAALQESEGSVGRRISTSMSSSPSIPIIRRDGRNSASFPPAFQQKSTWDGGQPAAEAQPSMVAASHELPMLLKELKQDMASLREAMEASHAETRGHLETFNTRVQSLEETITTFANEARDASGTGCTGGSAGDSRRMLPKLWPNK
mmetsp:Transcript_101028/g.253323  ORF Transcript_101028/g.253323 Transcript_101028/m.253323 type:complete len:723 (-) Transcript_101028:194-2362(-)